MSLLNAGTIGFKEIWAHKFRSILTMLGIILGVSSLVAMSALVKGMENGMREALIAIGGLEKIRIEEQDIPPSKAISRPGGREYHLRCLCAASKARRSSKWSPRKCAPARAVFTRGKQILQSLEFRRHLAQRPRNEPARDRSRPHVQ